MNQQIMQCINVVCSVLRTVWFLNLSHVTKVSVFDIEDIASTKRINISSAACKVLYRFHTGTFDRALKRPVSRCNYASLFVVHVRETFMQGELDYEGDGKMALYLKARGLVYSIYVLKSRIALVGKGRSNFSGVL